MKVLSVIWEQLKLSLVNWKIIFETWSLYIFNGYTMSVPNSLDIRIEKISESLTYGSSMCSNNICISNSFLTTTKYSIKVPTYRKYVNYIFILIGKGGMSKFSWMRFLYFWLFVDHYIINFLSSLSRNRSSSVLIWAKRKRILYLSRISDS